MTFDRKPVPDPRMDLGGGVKRSNWTFSEHGHVAYQIKENHGCSNMVANKKCPQTPSPPPTDPGGQKVKIQLFVRKKHVVYQIKGNRLYIR